MIKTVVWEEPELERCVWEPGYRRGSEYMFDGSERVRRVKKDSLKAGLVAKRPPCPTRFSRWC